METTRRGFGKCVSGLVALASAGLAFEVEQGGYDPMSPFLRLGNGFGSADEVASMFVQADSAFLMASYSVFFPEFLRRNTFEGAVTGLEIAAEEQKKKYTTNHHRLDALPSVAAAHLLQCAKEKKTRHFLAQTIVRGLKDPRREVKEIVLQNLMTSATVNFDSKRFFSVHPIVIRQIQRIFKESMDNEKLLTPTLIATEFLLNTRALLISRGATKKELTHYNKAIESIHNTRARHMWYVPHLIRLHNDTFRVSLNNIESLPPQSSEALMGCRKLFHAREYLALLALIRARLAYTIFCTMSGKLAPDAAMSVREAEKALPKVIGFFRGFELHTLLRSSHVLGLVSNEPEFANFLRAEFWELLDKPERFGVSVEYISPEMLQLGQCVPFARYDDRGRLEAALHEQDEHFHKAVCSALQVGLEAGVTLEVIQRVAAWFSGRKAALTKPPERQVIEKTRAEIVAREEAIDEGKYIGLDQQQATLGNIDISEFSTNGDDEGRSA